jgi:hypothetical protein
MRLISKVIKLLPDRLAIIDEYRVQDAADILDHYCLRHRLVNDADCGGKEVAFVVLAELLARL